jgi:two-component system KDP operon response regulator KdpE
LPQILIIDDDPGLLNVCRVGLEALGYLVRTAETGNEGLTEAAIRAPDVIVLDLGLPDLDGLEVCRRIRTWSDVPIVVLSADSSEDRKVDALDGGADDYMTKPFGMRELDARLRVAVRHRSAADDAEHPAELDVGSLHLDLVHYEATFERPSPRSHAEGVRLPCLPCPPRREGLHAPDDPGERLGSWLREGTALPEGVRLPDKAEAR